MAIQEGVLPAVYQNSKTPELALNQAAAGANNDQTDLNVIKSRIYEANSKEGEPVPLAKDPEAENEDNDSNSDREQGLNRRRVSERRRQANAIFARWYDKYQSSRILLF